MMNSNATLGSNFTNSTARTTSVFIRDIIIAYRTLGISISVLGTILNLWFLVAILSSQDTRSRLRNKIICNSFVLHLLDSLIILPINVVRVFRGSSCEFFSAMQNLVLIQDFISNWLLVMLLVVFIAQIQDFNPKDKLSPKIKTLGTVGLLIFPWVASLILVPVIVNEYYNTNATSRVPLDRNDCIIPTRDALEVFRSIDTALPIIFSLFLVVLAASLRYRRFTLGRSSRSMKTELVSRAHLIDKSLPYVVATVVSIFCDLFQLTYDLKAYYSFGFRNWFTIKFAALIMGHLRVVLMPLPWLLLPDIRQQIRTWRPWYRTAPGRDYAVAYNRDET